MKKTLFFYLILALAGPVRLSAQTNSGFAEGFKGWQKKGQPANFGLATTGFRHGPYCARIGPGKGALQTRINVGQLSIIQFKTYLKSGGKGIKGAAFISFYNAKNQLLLTYKGAAVDTTEWQETGNYTETPAGTSYAELGVEKETADGGYIYADDFSIETNLGVPKIKRAPLCDLDQCMRPFWRSDTVYNETVLLFSKNGQPAEGELLYTPDEILSVKDFSGKKTYDQTIDYALDGNVLTLPPNSRILFREDTSFDTKKDLAWFDTQSQWAVVTYTHKDKWEGPKPEYKGGMMARTLAKLRAKQPLKIAAFGMSITRGMDVSSYDTVPPYMPTYVDLFAGQLRKVYKYNDIKLFNAGLPGSVVDWGAQYADKYINPLKPDLVILDFGMNDFWRYTPDQFKGYIQTIIKKIKAANPKVEFILLSNMAFDPDYVLDSDKYKSFYQGNLEGYSKVLKAMEASGMANLDMYSISHAIYNKKKAKDCLVNPLHPNDYMARWYAQGLAALFVDNN